MEAKNLWNQTLVELEKQVPKQSVETWLRPLKVVGWEATRLTLEAPNNFIENWVNDHYVEQISSLVSKLASCAATVLIKKSDVSPPSEPRPFFSPKQTISSRDDACLNPKYRFDSFIVGPSNRFSHAAALAVAQSPGKSYNPLFIYGGVGLGKTHLLQAIGHLAKKTNPDLVVFYGSCEKFTNQLIDAIQNQTTLRFRNKYRYVDLLLLDDVQFIAGKESTQEEFFHTFNTLYDAHKQIVITSDSPPKEIPNLEERLISRFEWGLITDIQPPDLETRIAILRKKAEKEALPIPEDVTFFLADKIKSNIRELEGALIRLVAYACLVGNPITKELAQESLKDLFTKEDAEQHISIDLIQRKVSEHFDLSVADMKIKKRTKTVVLPRQLAMYLSRTLTACSLPEIGEYFGGRDHTTVLHAINVIEDMLKKDDGLRGVIEKMTNKIREKE